MKKFKTIDLRLDIILILASIAFAFIMSNEYSLLGYFIVGGWQILSMIVHEVNGYFNESTGLRRKYHLFVAILLSTALLGLIITPVLMLILYFLLFVSPFLALGYCYLCYHEIVVKMARPLAQLK
jgi:hypothetical protein